MRFPWRSIPCLTVIALSVGCSDDNPSVPADVVPEDVDNTVHVDAGNVGVMVDTRLIFRDGHLPETVRISFADYSQYDADLAVDPVTNLAIMTIHNDTLSSEDREAFGLGVTATIVVLDAAEVELARGEYPGLTLSDSNLPISLDSSVPPVMPTLVLREGLPYLLQPEGGDGFMALNCSDCYVETPYVFNDESQQFYFTEVGGEGSLVFNVQNFNEDFPGMSHWYMEAGTWLGIRGDAEGPEDFAIEPDREGYVRIRHVDSGLYLFRGTTDMRLNETGERFRIISDNIDWSFSDRGTRYNQPIMPPARLDFAYSGRLRNCSSAILEESVGRSESRTSTTSISTTEGLELFAGSVQSAEVSFSTSVSASIGFEGGIGASSEVQHTTDKTWAQEFTTTQTVSSEMTWSEETSQTVEVSRTRTVTVPEFTVVDVEDAIKTIENVRIPFTQLLRITAVDRRTDSPLTGAEIRTQLATNFVTGLVTEIGPDFVQVSIRGEALVDQMLNASTLVQEIARGCE